MYCFPWRRGCGDVAHDKLADLAFDPGRIGRHDHVLDLRGGDLHPDRPDRIQVRLAADRDIQARIADVGDVEHEAQRYGWQEIPSVGVRSRGGEHFGGLRIDGDQVGVGESDALLVQHAPGQRKPLSRDAAKHAHAREEPKHFQSERGPAPAAGRKTGSSGQNRCKGIHNEVCHDLCGCKVILFLNIRIGISLDTILIHRR